MPWLFQFIPKTRVRQVNVPLYSRSFFANARSYKGPLGLAHQSRLTLMRLLCAGMSS